MLQPLLATIARTASICLTILAIVFSFRIAQEQWTKPLAGPIALAIVLAAAICLCPGSLRDWLLGTKHARGWIAFCTAAVWWFAGLIIVHQIQTGSAVNWCLWLPMLAAEYWSRQSQGEQVETPPVESSAAQPPVPVVVSSPENVADFATLRQPVESANDVVNEESAIEELTNDDWPPLPANITQQWTRQRTDDEESTRGLLRVPFAPDEQTAVVHISFTPPFAVEPEIEASVLEGAEAEVHVTQVYPYGARLEVRRSRENLSAADAVIEILAAAQSIV